MKNILTAVLLLAMSATFAQDGKFDLKDFHLDKEYRLAKNGTIDLSSSDAKVFITGSARSNVHVKIDRVITVKGWSNISDFSVEVTETEGNLRIRENQQGTNVSVGYYREEYKIEIEAPENANLTIRGDDGDYFIKNVNGSIMMSVDDADAELTGCKGGKFSFRFDDGDLRMDQGRGFLELDADDADVEIYNAQFASVEADVDDGDMIIETSLSDNGTYNLQSQDGLISLRVTGGGGEFDIHHDDGSVSTQGNYKMLMESDDRTKVSLPGGNAKVAVRADDARVKLTVK